MSTPSSPRYPDVDVNLSDNDGNAFAIIGRVTKALRRAGVGKETRDEYTKEATSGDYDHLLQTSVKWVNVN